MKLKKILAVSLIGLCSLAATSCNQGGGDGELSGDGDITYDANGEVVYDNVKLKMWSVTTGDDAGTQDQIVNTFNEMYKGLINVEVEHYSRYDLETLLQNTIQFDTQNAPDVLFNHGSRTSEYNARGWLNEVDFFFEKSKAAFDKADFAPSLLESVTIDNKTISGETVPCLVFIWNTDSGIQETDIPLTGIFDPSNYYSKSEVDEAISAATSGINDTLTAHTANTTVHVTAEDKTAWSGKQDALVSGTNIKTVGGNSLLGSGDIPFPDGMTAEVSGTTLIFNFN